MKLKSSEIKNLVGALQAKLYARKESIRQITDQCKRIEEKIKKLQRCCQHDWSEWKRNNMRSACVIPNKFKTRTCKYCGKKQTSL